MEKNKNSKIINITVEEKPTGEIMAGAGFGTDGGTIDFGVKENNYLGKGILLDANFQLTEETIKGKFFLLKIQIIKILINLLILVFKLHEIDKLSDFGYKTNKTGFEFGTNFEYL